MYSHLKGTVLSMQLASISGLFPEDVVARARELGPAIKLGAYTASVGHPKVRGLIAEGITLRDGHPSDPDSIFLGSMLPPPWAQQDRHEFVSCSAQAIMAL